MKYDIIEEYFEIEKAYINQNKVICGIDEAGRGPLAGPVCAAAVIMPPDDIIEGIRDSKKISAHKREMLYKKIIDTCIDYAIEFVDNHIIDEINIHNATFLAMNRALNKLKIKPDIILVDGYKIPNIDIEQHAIIKGDMRSYSIACASILAKVSRDRFMINISHEFPGYFFEKHKGYGTKLHIDVIRNIGPSSIHRRTFLKNILG